MSRPFDTPREALDAMVAAGAVFSVRSQPGSLGPAFTYRVTDDGDLAECRRILASVKSKPPQFADAFRILVHQHVPGATAP